MGAREVKAKNLLTFTADMWMTLFVYLTTYINGKHPNIRFAMETEVNHNLPFSDLLLDNSNPVQSLVTSVFRKSTYTGLLTNFLSFSPFSYKLGLTRTLVDRTFKINNTWTGFHNNIKELMQ